MSFSGTSCPLPFLSSDNYTSGGGYIEGRFCSDKCCLPCPLTELVYSDGEYIIQKAALKQADIV